MIRVGAEEIKRRAATASPERKIAAFLQGNPPAVLWSPRLIYGNVDPSRKTASGSLGPACIRPEPDSPPASIGRGFLNIDSPISSSRRPFFTETLL